MVCYRKWKARRVLAHPLHGASALLAGRILAKFQSYGARTHDTFKLASQPVHKGESISRWVSKQQQRHAIGVRKVASYSVQLYNVSVLESIPSLRERGTQKSGQQYL